MRKALLVGVNVNDTDENFQYSMEELGNLAVACNMVVVGEVTQNLHKIHPAHYIGAGKLEEVKEKIDLYDVDVIIFDDELSPSQIKNLEKRLDVPIIDRTMLILDIFAERAKTRESQLQVEMARLKYLLPRLVGSNEFLGRQGGGAGLKNRGAGETKLELDRRKIETKIAALNKELEKLLTHRQTQRNLRKKQELPIVSLVGYTNAGKSTIMNAFVEATNKGEGKQVFEKDMLFATLETYVREVRLPDHKRFLLTDTVGFINKLPHHLVKAFRSTLEEVVEADLLLHVIDASNPHHEGHKRLTNEILEQIGAAHIPMIYVYNKADKTDQPYPVIEGNTIYLSAKQRIGLEELSEIIRQHIYAREVRLELFIPFADGHVVSYLNENVRVLSTEYLENGTKLVVECGQKDARRFEQYVTHAAMI